MSSVTLRCPALRAQRTIGVVRTTPGRSAVLHVHAIAARAPSSRWPRISDQQLRANPQAEVLVGDQEQELPAVIAGVVQDAWRSIEARNKLVLGCGSAFVLSNMDKVNVTVAIIPIAHELGWSSTVAGLVQSSFFWGFLLAQLPAGALSSRIGGDKMLPRAVGLWSVATAMLPFAATSMPALCASRCLVGLGEAFAPSAIVDMLARTVPKEKRAGAVATAFSGLHVGSILGLIITPHIIDAFGWRSVFLVYGLFGVGWIASFNALLANIAEQDPAVAALLESSRRPEQLQATPDAASASTSAPPSAVAAPSHASIPYRAMLRDGSVRALMFTHFAHNWFQYTMLAWLPSYFTDTLNVDLMHAAQTALLPPLAGIVFAQVAGRGVDAAIGAGAPLPLVRKAAQTTAFLVPAALLVALSLDADVQASTTLSVACVTGALGASSFSLAGLYCTHQDLSPKYASAMLGLTNTAASVPGIVGVALTGFLLDQTNGSWEVSLFAPAALCLTAGAGVYAFCGRNDATDFDAADNTPFAWESRFVGVQRGWGALARAAGAVAAAVRRPVGGA